MAMRFVEVLEGGCKDSLELSILSETIEDTLDFY